MSYFELTLSTLTVILSKFTSLDAVSRYRDPQLQVGENYLYLFSLKQFFSNLVVFKRTHLIPNNRNSIGQQNKLQAILVVIGA